MKEFKILDCTFRDGGYYTNWSFETELVRDLVKALDGNVDIIELGYKSPLKGGPYRKCNDGFISSVINFPIKSDLAFMIDVKDFVEKNRLNEKLLRDTIKPASLFKICRVAAKYNEAPHLTSIVKILKELNYTVICNLMGVSLLEEEQVMDFKLIIDGLDIEAFYIADSYGSLLPKDVKSLSSYASGIHTHDNMGLAFANCLAAIENGVKYIDGTITGMGRGVGNVTTEQLLVHKGIMTPEIFNLVEKFNILKHHYGWGKNIIFHQSGRDSIHPLYSQGINQWDLSSKQTLKILETLKSRNSFDDDYLKSITKQKVAVIIPARYKSTRFPGKPLAKILGREMVLRVADQAKEAVGKENVYIATENKQISDLVTKDGYKAILTSDDCLTGTDRVAEASLEIDADIIVNIQGDEPMVNPNDIVKAIELKSSNKDYVINCMSNLHKDEEATDKKIPKVICNLNNELIYSSRSVLPGSKQGDYTSVKKQVCIYVFNKKQLKEFNSNKKTPLESIEDIEIVRCLEKGMKVKMLELNNVSYAVDYPEDIVVIENNWHED